MCRFALKENLLCFGSANQPCNDTPDPKIFIPYLAHFFPVFNGFQKSILYTVKQYKVSV